MFQTQQFNSIFNVGTILVGVCLLDFGCHCLHAYLPTKLYTCKVSCYAAAMKNRKLLFLDKEKADVFSVLCTIKHVGTEVEN